MPYVVYFNHPTDRAMIHSTACGKFIKRRRDKTLNGYWSIIDRSIIDNEPFDRIEDAQRHAERIGKKNIDTCAFCIR